MSMFSLFCIVCISTSIHTLLVQAIPPVARYVRVPITVNADHIITLQPYDAENSINYVNITSLPSQGTLYQTSANYETYGYTPARTTIPITTIPSKVNSATYKLVYVSPMGISTIGKHAITFTYVVMDNENFNRSGIVTLLPYNERILVSSLFYIDNEGWITQTAVTTNTSWSGTSSGNLLNYFIYAGDMEPTLYQRNDVIWYLQAPSKFYGDMGAAYNGYLQFALGSFAGDFSAASLRALPFTFVTLTCASCNNGLGITLAQRNVRITGNAQQFNFTLNEAPASGWLKDPRNFLTTVWPSPSACEFVSVLRGLTSIKLFADVTIGYEVMALDTFQFVAPNSNVDGIPLSCYS